MSATPLHSPAGGRRISMPDVARLAGVSAQTVSRVSSGSPGVAEATRQQVIAAMNELGYRPNSAARALKRGSFRTIGVILFSLSSTGNARTLEAIALRAAEEDYAVALIPVSTPTQAGMRGAFSRLNELAVDAVIVIMEIHLLDAGTMFLPPGVHAVVVDSDASDDYTVIDSDQANGSRMAVEHLLSLGHQTVWHMAGPEESFASERRITAWRTTLAAHGCTEPPLLRGDWSADSGYEAGLSLADSDCTAVFVSNDQMALGVLRAFHERGIRVPQDVSVVGFDDIPDSSSFSPPLTTVHQDFAAVGRRCVDKALKQMRENSTEPGRELVPTRLIVRESTAGASGARSRT
ncbi:LacI family DNA-binding transcriptional regulator [Pengzhenrongella sicca]|uniref:LacI family DNA-binding transcriptional regulator n=1 Tax=Pengzhenrongella sicca TaxID=2819238 RepID=A0A8A4ZHT0_9MICO|nr:LacI family DNA-binding transcriptional regulator [Pengzhenrongella sicca]QTE30077.1 LacI family DNA-binding transcriptional regulator [Pengzhenrongella sicca]